MFEKSKGRYLTRGVDSDIPLALQVFMWKCIDELPKECDYLQVFNIVQNGKLLVITHISEQPEHSRKYIFTNETPLNAKVYVIDDGDHCTMLLAEEY